MSMSIELFVIVVDTFKLLTADSSSPFPPPFLKWSDRNGIELGTAEELTMDTDEELFNKVVPFCPEECSLLPKVPSLSDFKIGLLESK